jgi:integrase
VVIDRLPNKRFRVRVSHEGKYYSAAKILGMRNGPSWRTKGEAKEAGAQAEAILKGRSRTEITVREFWEQWTSDPLFTARWKETTAIHYRERTTAFVATFGDIRLAAVDDLVVRQWLRGGNHRSTVPTLRAMLNDAMSGEAGRLIEWNPFAGLGLARTKGRKDEQPPTTDQMETMVRIAKELTPPSYAAYLEFACLTGARPGELDALQWERVRLDDGEVDLFEQFAAKTRKFTTPKYGPYTAALVGRARDVLLRMPRQDVESPFVFLTNRGTHYTPSSRTHHWNRVRCAAGLPDMTLYLATRHHFGWYALNVLGLEPHIIAEQLGHKDGGKLVVELYGHPDQRRARRLIREAFEKDPNVKQLHLVEGKTA